MKLRSHLLVILLGLSVLSSAMPQPSLAAIMAAAPPGAITVVPTPRTQGEAFGSSMAIDGDTLVVGAPLADVGSDEEQGAVYVFEQNNDGQWQQVKRITVADGNAFDRFGGAVALHGDTLVVGAIFADPGGITNQGAAYIFYRNQGGADNWGFVKKLTGSDDDALDNYGNAVAIHGDNLFVSSPNHDHSGATSATGMVYHYRRNQGGPNAWGEVQRLTDPDRHQGDNYGSALAFDGATLVVGSQRADLPDDPNDQIPPEPNNNVGAAFVYTSTVASTVASSASEDAEAIREWQQADILYPSDGYANVETGNLRFGAAVALQDDLIAVGAPSTRGTNGDLSVGSVYVFRHDDLLGGWVEADKLGASDPAASASFGQALVATPDGILVYASKGNGILYAFQLNLAASEQTTGQTDEQTDEEWQEVARFAAGSEYFQAGYGRVLAASYEPGDEHLAVGAPSLESSTGGVYLHEPEEIFTAPAVPGSTIAYLPLLVYETPPLQITGQLKDGGKVMGPDGTGIAAPAGSLAAPLNVSLLRAPTPATGHQDPIQPASRAYRFGSEVEISTAIALPFIFALPVDSGADTAHLALAALVPPETLQDVGDIDPGDEGEWLYFEGEYDAANRRFLSTWPVLVPEGVVLAVVEHPSFDTPSNAEAARTEHAINTNPEATQFIVRCLGFFVAGQCTAATEIAVAELLSQIHERMTAAGGFAFREPRLRYLAENLNFDAASLASLGYSAYIERHTARYCLDNLGYYQYWTGRLVLCLAPNEPVGEDQLAGLIHEYFHATQFAYPEVYKDAVAGTDENWLIEGMATTAMESYFLDTGLRRFDGYGGPRPVDVSLDSEEGYDEYLAQDFWVYLGKQLPGADLSYLKIIFQYGADKSATDEGLRHQSTTNFQDQFWDWASNQVFEKQETLDGALGVACSLETAALRAGIPVANTWDLVPAPQLSYWPSGGGEAVVPPYTTLVVEMNFPFDSTAEAVRLDYPQCIGIDDFNAWRQCYADAQEKLPAKFYTQNREGCFDYQVGRVVDTDSGSEIFENIETERRYFAVATNTTDTDQRFHLWAELPAAP